MKPHGPRLATFDAMRGIAALAVVQFHFELVLRPQDRLVFGFLAVDLFFMLSGFVLSYSYGPRLASGLRPAAFLLRRAVRLFPAYVLGLGLGIYVIRHTPLANSQPAWAPLFEIFMLPPIPTVADMPVFPALLPAWSLFFEFYVANVLFAIPALHTSRKMLTCLIGGSALLLLVAVYAYGSLDVGALGKNFWGGFPRVGLSFFIGVALEHIRRRAPPKRSVPSWIILAALVACLWCPLARDAVGPFFEVACVFVVFPALVYFGSTAKARLPRAGALLGDTSYALYAIHFPLVIELAKRLIHAGQTADRLTELVFILAVSGLALLIAKFIDEPVRRWLWTQCSRRLRLKTRKSISA